MGNWPSAAWADALDALSAAWRAGDLPGWLFNGTRASNAAAIARIGMLATEGAASPAGDGGCVAFELVHLGTPEVAAWYMHDTAVNSGRAPALVAVDVSGWLRSRGRRRPIPLVDENSIEAPALSAIGARSADDVRRRLGPSPGWKMALAITGTVCFDEPSLPPDHLRVLRTPAHLMSYLRRESGRSGDCTFAEAVAMAASAHPWEAEGWRFRARSLGQPTVPDDSLDDGEFRAKYGLGRGPG